MERTGAHDAVVSDDRAAGAIEIKRAAPDDAVGAEPQAVGGVGGAVAAPYRVFHWHWLAIPQDHPVVVVQGTAVGHMAASQQEASAPVAPRHATGDDAPDATYDE